MKNTVSHSKFTKFGVFMKYRFLLSLLMLFNISLHAQNLKLGLEGYWTFECSPKDITANGRTAVFEGAPLCVEGKFGQGYLFNGSTDFAKLGKTGTAPLYSAQGFSWSIWFNGSDLPTASSDGFGQILISAADEGLGEDIILGFGNMFSPKHTLFFEVDSAGGFGGVMTQSPGWRPSAGWVNNKWYHAVAVADYPNKVIILYVDGEERARKSFGGIPVARDMNVSFGAFFDGSDRQGRFKGILDDIRIYRRALTPDEVTALYELDVNQLSADKEKIDFETIICENSAIETFTIFNAGEKEIELSDAIFSNGAAFNLNAGLPVRISGGSSVELEVSFMPPNVGSFLDTLLIDNSLGLPPILLYLSGSKDSLGVWLTPIVDFAKLENGQIDSRQALIVNTGTVPIELEEIPALTAPFNIASLNRAVPSQLNPGDTLIAEITFTAIGGVSRDTLAVNAFTPCGEFSYKIPIVGEGSYRAFITLQIPTNLQANPGEHISVPILMNRSEFIREAEVERLKAKLIVNPTLLITSGNTPAGYLENGSLIVEVEFQCRNQFGDGSIANFDFIAALGDSESSPISIIDVTAVSGLATIETIPGSFNILGVCKEGGSRLFSSRGNLQLQQSKPNPSDGIVEFEFEVIEKGMTRLYVIDGQGGREMTIMEKNLNPGVYTVSWNAGELSSGLYFYVLKTPSDVLTKKLQIIK